MIDALPQIDLLEYTPDASGVDLLDQEFSPKTIPCKPGCYAFFERVTGKLMYVGSAAATGGWFDGAGLHMRLRDYRQARKGKVRDLLERERWTLSYWVMASEGDARKAEADTIRKYLPPHNEMSVDRHTREERIERMRQARKEKRARRISREVYNPDDTKVCCSCQQEKKCSEFPRHKHGAKGVYSACRVCSARQQRERRERIKAGSV